MLSSCNILFISLAPFLNKIYFFLEAQMTEPITVNIDSTFPIILQKVILR